MYPRFPRSYRVIRVEKGSAKTQAPGTFRLNVTPVANTGHGACSDFRRDRADVGAESGLERVPELNVDRRRQESRQERFQRTKHEIAGRLAMTCADMPEPEFDEFVTHMAELQIKYALRRSADLFPEVLEWERGSVDVT